MIYTKSFMQITFRYEFVQVFFQDMPPLLKQLNGCKCYRALKKIQKGRQVKLLIPTALFFYLFIYLYC